MKAYRAMIVRRCARVLLTLGAMACAVAAARAGSVDAVRIGPNGPQHRLEFDMSERPPFRVFTLEAPYRIVVDFPETEWNIAEPEFSAGFPVSRMRFGLYKPGRSRMVLDLKRPMRVAAAYTRPDRDGAPPRFVLDLAETDEASYRETAGWPSDAHFETVAERRGPRPPLPRPPGLGPAGTLLVMLDPGHGGVDPGAIRSGIQEKNIVLAFAAELRGVLERTGRYRVAMTRETDMFLSLRERVRLAEMAGADVFISIHADTVKRGDASGAAVHTLSDTATDQEAAELAELENRSDILAGVNLAGESDDVARILIDLSQRQTNHASDRLAEAMLDGLAPRIALLETRPHRSAGFRVLRSPTVPSLLLELGFMSNDRDRENLVNPTWRRRAALGVADALDAWRDEFEGARLAQR